jgi:hypothetical protein
MVVAVEEHPAAVAIRKCADQPHVFGDEKLQGQQGSLRVRSFGSWSSMVIGGGSPSGRT